MLYVGQLGRQIFCLLVSGITDFVVISDLGFISAVFPMAECNSLSLDKPTLLGSASQS